MTLIYILTGLLINTILGAAICATLDTKDQVFYNWYKEDPTKGILSFAILNLWPIMAFFMIRYRKDQQKYELNLTPTPHEKTNKD